VAKGEMIGFSIHPDRLHVFDAVTGLRRA